MSVVDTMNGQVWNDDAYWVDVARGFGVKTLQARPASHPQGIGTHEGVQTPFIEARFARVPPAQCRHSGHSECERQSNAPALGCARALS